MNIGIGGKLGSGKTLSAVMFAHKRSIEHKKRYIISNIKLNIPTSKNIHIENDKLVFFIKKNYTNYEVLKKTFSDTILVLDEVVNLINARKSNSLINELFINFFMQLGKLNCDLIYTFQVEQSQVDLIMREICDIYLTAFKLDAETKKPLIFEKRITDKKILICLMGKMDLNILGIKPIRYIFNPEQYYQMYDTSEMSLLDRSAYLSGGKKDIRKI